MNVQRVGQFVAVATVSGLAASGLTSAQTTAAECGTKLEDYAGHNYRGFEGVWDTLWQFDKDGKLILDNFEGKPSFTADKEKLAVKIASQEFISASRVCEPDSGTPGMITLYWQSPDRPWSSDALVLVKIK
ncbi:hypothetical protein OG394_03445 [Kribbella sp. NBC_01245]|uniref:hypothetical protein n=1 Tax=Kribbella sp. NBC_01245 TaxID=2903578 RepID=UPI002E2BAC12|nr:hypothetical protein [Kribbella sp. NBC_01245]